MSTKSCSKRAQKMVSTVKAKVPPKRAESRVTRRYPEIVTPSQSQTVESVRQKRSHEVSRPFLRSQNKNKKTRQEDNSLRTEDPVEDNLSLDIVLSDEDETPNAKKENLNKTPLEQKPKIEHSDQTEGESTQRDSGPESPIQVTENTSIPPPPRPLETLPFFRGFKNLGNTCYMNAILQALLSLSPFQTDIQDFYFTFCLLFSSPPTPPSETVNSTSSTSPSLPHVSFAKIPHGLIEAFIDIMEQVNSQQSNINGFPLKMAVSQQVKRFADFRQQDAHEFFLCLLDQISDEVVETMKAANKLNGKHQEYKDFCPTTKNFDCIVEHSLTCSECSDTTRVTELFRDFSLEVPSPIDSTPFTDYKPTLQTLMEAFFSTDEVDRRCEKCAGNRARVTHKIVQLPRILVLHLKRFRLDFKRSTYTKITRKVLINPQLDISFCCSGSVRVPSHKKNDPTLSYMPSHGTVSFDLHCITHHIGRYASAGHYISDVRVVSSRQEDQRWYSYNDTIVTEISQDEALNEDRESYGYMFFYLLRTA